MKKYEQLDLKTRYKLENELKTSKSLSEIAKNLNYSRQTLYREILRNSFKQSKDTHCVRSSCVHIKNCIYKQKNVYRSKILFTCPVKCSEYKPGKQECLKKFPFVCNYCAKRKYCKYLQYYYDAENASNQYHQLLKESKSQLKTECDVVEKIDKIVSPLLKKGQSIEAIKMNHPEITVSALTLRNWVDHGRIKAVHSDFRMFGRRTPSKRYNYSKKKNYTMLNELKLQHKYVDYLEYIKRHPNALIVQLDTVIGCANGNKSLLTIHLVQYKFQFGFLLDNHTAGEVYQKISAFMNKLKALDDEYGFALNYRFSECLLTDNGPEFDSLLELEKEFDCCHIFYCRPYSSFEKGSCERNHELIRYIHYKGKTMDNLTQENIDTLFSHLNSYPRKSLQKKTPYQCVLETLGKEFLEATSISHINADDVTLNPSLIYKIKK